MIYSLYIHRGDPPMVREVMPGESLALHIALPATTEALEEHLGPIYRSFDFVITVGFEFSEMAEPVQYAVRRLMMLQSAVIRFDRC